MIRCLLLSCTFVLSLIIPTNQASCQTPTRKGLYDEIVARFRSEDYTSAVDLSKKAQELYGSSPDSLYVNMLFYEGVSLYRLNRHQESFDVFMSALGIYDKMGRDDMLTYNLHDWAAYLARHRLPESFTLQLVHNLLSVRYWQYKDFDSYREVLFRTYGLASREEKEGVLEKELSFTQGLNHKHLTPYLYYVIGNMQLWENFDGTKRPYGTMSDPRHLPEDRKQIIYAISLLEQASAGFIGSKDSVIQKYYVETLLLLCSAYEGLGEWGEAKRYYDLLWPLLQKNWREWDCTSPFSYPDIFFRGILRGDTWVLDKYTNCLSQASNHEQILDVCREAMNQDWFKSVATVFNKNIIIGHYNYAARLLERPMLESVKDTEQYSTEIEEYNSYSLIEDYKKGLLSDKSLKEKISPLELESFDYNNPFYVYLDSIGDYKTIIQYINEILNSYFSREDLTVVNDELDEDVDFYEIGGYPVNNKYGLDFSQITADDIRIGSERDFIHHMNGGYSIIYVYSALASAYWESGDYTTAISTLAHLHEIVRTDWKWDPGERQELFEIEITDEEFDSWPLEYYFSMELDTKNNLARCLYQANRKDESYGYWRESLSLCKKALACLLSTGDYSVKSSRWSNWTFILSQFSDLSRIDYVTPELATIILDAVTFQNSYLTRLNSQVQNYVSKSNNTQLKENYLKYKQAGIALERVYYKKGVLGRDIESLERKFKESSRQFFSLLPGEKVLPTSYNPIERLDDLMSDKDLFVQFVSSNYSKHYLSLLSESGLTRELEIPNNYISAIVYGKHLQGPLLLGLGVLDIDIVVDGGKKLVDYIPAYNSTITKEDINLPYLSTSFGKGIWEEIKNVAVHYGAERVFFIPSGAVNDIAIENLSLSEGHPISEDFDIHRITSIESIKKADERFAPKSYGVVIGGIQYGKSVATPNDRIGEFQERLSPIMDRDAMGKLVGTELEMMDILGLAPSFFKKKSGLEPTEEFFASLSGRSPQILHIGTHGINKTYDWISDDEYEYLYGYQKYGVHNYSEMSHTERAMYETGLLVAPSEEINTSGFLSAKEISSLDYSGTDLISLSACSTGLGVVDSEGVNGLSRAFKMAGVNSILASLWNVSDDATRLLMKEFYVNYMKRGMTKSESLRKAKGFVRTYSDHGIDEYGIVNISGVEHKFSDPYYWAGFVLID